MNAIDIARRNFPNYRFPKNKYVRGVYFKTKENLKLKKIVYRAMVPGDIRERIINTSFRWWVYFRTKC